MDSQSWYVGVDGNTRGPFATNEVIRQANAGEIGPDALVFARGVTAGWVPLRSVSALSRQISVSAVGDLPPLPPASGRRSDEIDYRIQGDDLQYVEIELDPGESVVAEAGSMMYLSAGVQMETKMGDGSRNDQGMFGKLLDGAKRVISGESLFLTHFTHQGHGKGTVALAASYPGKILPMDLKELGGTLMCQKDSFLACAKGVRTSIAFQKRLGAGFFGGEGFILQKIEGDGLAFIHAGGAILRRTLQAGEVLRVDTGCVVAFAPSVDFDIQYIGGIKSALFGGEGFFFATLRGPGEVWLQSLPLSRLANRIFAASNAGGRKGGEQGTLLTGIGGGLLGGLVLGNDD